MVHLKLSLAGVTPAGEASRGRCLHHPRKFKGSDNFKRTPCDDGLNTAIQPMLCQLPPTG